MTTVTATIEKIVLCRWCGRKIGTVVGDVERLTLTCTFRDCKLTGQVVIR